MLRAVSLIDSTLTFGKFVGVIEKLSPLDKI